MRRPLLGSLVFGVATILTAQGARATSPHEPTLGEMVAESRLIVLAEVVESTPFYSRVRSIETFKGEAPMSDFVVSGYNDTCWPKADRDREATTPQLRYLFFLQPIQAERSVATTTVPWAACGEPLLPKPWRTLPRYAVPAPTTGDYRVETRGIASDSRFCSSCAGNLRVPTKLALPILRALAQPNESELVAEGRSLLSRELTVALVDLASKDAAAKARLAWLLEGQAAFGGGETRAPLLLAANSAAGDTRQAAVRALPSLGANDEVMQIIDDLFKACQNNESDALQVEATRALVMLDPKGHAAVDRILRALPNACSSETVHRDDNTPSNRPWVSAREVMVRNLTHYRALQAEAAMLGLLRKGDNAAGTLDAIMTHFSLFRSTQATTELLRQYATLPTDQLDRFNRYFTDAREPAALEVMFGRMLHESVSIEHSYPMLRYYAMHSPRGDQRLENAVLRLLETHAGEAELCYLSPLAISLKNERLVRRLLEFDPTSVQDMDPKTRERIARAVQLQRSTTQGSLARQRAWLQLLIDDRWTGYATPFLFREFVCNTPVAMRPELKHWLEQEQLDALVTSLGRFAVSPSQQEPPGANATGSMARLETREFQCFSAAPDAPSSALAPRVTGTVTVTSPLRSGCGAGCATTRTSRSTSLWTAIAFSLFLLRRKRQSGTQR